MHAAPTRRVLLHLQAHGGDPGLTFMAASGPGGRQLEAVVVARVTEQHWGQGCPVGPGSRLLSVNGVLVEALGVAGVQAVLFPSAVAPLACLLLEFQVEA